MKYRSWSAVAAIALATFGGAVAAAAPSAAAGAQTGELYLTAGGCSHGSISGSYIQMVLPSGTVSGPYMSNSDSTCSNQAYTLLTPGSEGGLRFGSYQPLPSPAFDAHGNAKATAISAPASYEGTGFATSTNPVDPQTHTKVPAPSLTIQGTKVSADVSSWSVSWNNQYFNQGSPKPDGSHPGITRPATGTFNPSTGAMTLNWTSEVVGGPFDKFTGSWHLVGRFVPTSAGTTGSASGHSGGSGTAVAPSTAASASATATAVAHGDKATPGASASASSEPAAAVATPQAAVISVVSKRTWHVSWWLIVLALVIAVAGFGGLAALRRSGPTDSASS